MKKKFLTVLVALIAALAVVCFAAAVSEEPEDVKKDTIVDDTEIDPVVTTGVVTETDATATDATETDAPETDATATDATATDATATDATGTDATATDATATDARQLGDVDGDGKIKPEDARLALRASVHLEKYAEDSDEFFAADINANGVIEPEDARKILLASVNLFDLNDPLATPTDPEPEEPDATPTDATPTDATPTDATPTDATPTDATPTDAIDYLVLVNKTYKLPADWESKVELVDAQNEIPEGVVLNAGDAYLATDVFKVEKKSLEAFRALQADLKEEGVVILLDSTYRSVARQEELWKEFEKKFGLEYTQNTVAVPGTSEHHTGLAIDVCIIKDGVVINNNNDMIAEREIFAKIHAKLADYGFILRYPENGQEITGYSYEPWHFRYVGVDAAKEIAAQGVTLEEYLGK